MVFDLTSNKVAGDPDGMTIDTDGNLWLACFNSNHVSFFRKKLFLKKKKVVYLITIIII